jgi:NhaP-type Na+/H+ or K+/H+ antiporter
MPMQCPWLDVGGSLLNVVMAMKLSDRLATGARPVQVRYALASEAGFDDGQAQVSARVGDAFVFEVRVFDVDAALPHLLVDMVQAEAPREFPVPMFRG